MTFIEVFPGYNSARLPSFSQVCPHLEVAFLYTFFHTHQAHATSHAHRHRIVMYMSFLWVGLCVTLPEINGDFVRKRKKGV